MRPSAAKAVSFLSFMAQLKPCPDTKLVQREFFRSLKPDLFQQLRAGSLSRFQEIGGLY